MENNQEILIENKSLKFKSFDFFYSILSNKNQTNFFTLYILYILEIIQLISFAFSAPHLLTWKISSKTSLKISIIISSFRLTPLLQFVSSNIFVLIFIIFIFLTFAFFLLMIIQILFIKENNKIYNKLILFIKLLIPFFSIFLYIPMIELFAFPLKCVNNKYFIMD